MSAQIRTDGTLGPAAQGLAGPAFVIPQTLGRLSGANLFHSFSTFNVGSGESATFSTATPGIANVISRVTGGSPSFINGTLRLSAASGAPDFFFINPAGVAFGKGATVDVPGALHVGTADNVRFADGRFYADPQKASSFSSAPPEAFGFLGTNRAALTLSDGALVVTRRGHGVSLVAGDVGLDGASVGAGAAEIRIAAVGRDAVDVGFSGPLPATSGLLDLRNGASVTSFAIGGPAGGPIRISAGDMSLDSGAYLYSTHDTAAAGAAAKGGDIDLAVRNTLWLANGASISTDAVGAGNAGNVHVAAGRMGIDTEAYVYSSAAAGSTGAPGGVDVNVAGALAIGPGASISTSAFGSGAAQPIRINAASFAIDGGYVLGEGAGGSAPISVDVAGLLAIDSKGFIKTQTTGAADAGAVRVRAGSLRMDNQAEIGSSAAGATGGAGRVDVAVAGAAVLDHGALIASVSASAGDAADVTVRAADLSLNNKSSVNSNAGYIEADKDQPRVSAASGNIAVAVTGSLTLNNESAIDTSTLQNGAAGNVHVRARDITLDGVSHISSQALDGTGNAGAVDVASAGQLTLRGESLISTGTDTAGHGGALRVDAAGILLDGGSYIDSTTGPSSTGRGGNLVVNAAGAIQLLQASNISVVTSGAGDAGNLQVTAGSVLLDGRSSFTSASNLGSTGAAGNIGVKTTGDVLIDHNAYITSDAFGLGNAGNVSLQARHITLDNGATIASDAFITSLGTAGRIDLLASGNLSLLATGGPQTNGSMISTNAFSSGNAGSVHVQAANVKVDSSKGILSVAANGTGNAGDIDVLATGDVTLTQGTISTSTATSGNAGTVRIRASNLTVDGATTSILNGALLGSTGRAGNIDLQLSGDLVVTNGSITSSTAGAGAAGSVQVQAGRVVIAGENAGISAAAEPTSGGQVGSVQIVASEAIAVLSGGYISITNGATVSDPASRQPTTLRLSAPVIALQQGVVNASSIGNVAASDIVVDFSHLLVLDRSAIATVAVNGNGGAVRLQGGDAVVLRQSQVTTSVFGTNANGGVGGNGGDIEINARALALDRGFVQANTAASNASGGLVRVAIDSLVTGGSSLLLGGNTAYNFRDDVAGFNVIQAAAPTGISGVIEVTSPVLDVTGSLRVLRADVIDAGGLGRSPCQTSGGSSLALAGRGGLPPSARGLMRAERDARDGGALPSAQGPEWFLPKMAAAAPPWAAARTNRGCW